MTARSGWANTGITDAIDKLVDGGFPAELEVLWRQATEVMFSETQRVVHVWPVDGGTLKASGSFEVLDDGDVMVGLVEYSAPYAVFEFARGGDHDALHRSFERTRDVFQRACDTAIERWVNG